MVVSLNEGTPKKTPKYSSPYYVTMGTSAKARFILGKPRMKLSDDGIFCWSEGTCRPYFCNSGLLRNPSLNLNHRFPFPLFCNYKRFSGYPEDDLHFLKKAIAKCYQKHQDRNTVMAVLGVFPEQVPNN